MEKDQKSDICEVNIQVRAGSTTTARAIRQFAKVKHPNDAIYL